MKRRKPLMRLVGDDMIVGVKNISKFIGISVIACCAVFVCAMFLSYYIDIQQIESEVNSAAAMIFYQAQVLSAKVICLITGGCLLATSVVMLFFYIKHYIDTNKKQLGILKALGYSDFSIAKSFWVFGITVFIGTAIGFGGAVLMMPWLYSTQNVDKILPEMSVHFHPRVLLCLVILPSIVFAILAIIYAWGKLRKPVLSLMRDTTYTSLKAKRLKEDKESGRSFIDDLKSNTLKSKKTLVFFMVFASFAFSSLTQMSFSMKDLSSVMMGLMMLLIGLVLAFTTLYIAITTVINGNTKTIAMMRVFGYSQKECCRAILGGYRPISYIGFAIGTVYQYALLRIVVDIVFKDVADMPVYKFDFPMMLVSLAVFILVYEIIMHRYSEKIKNISLKEIMME